MTTVSRKNFLNKGSAGDYISAQGYVLMPALPEFDFAKFLTNPDVIWVGRDFVADYDRKHKATSAVALHWVKCTRWNRLQNVTLWTIPSISQLYNLLETKPCLLGDLNFMVTDGSTNLNFYCVIVEKVETGWSINAPRGWFIRPYGTCDVLPAIDRYGKFPGTAC